MIVRKGQTWHRLPRHCERLEAAAVIVGDEGEERAIGMHQVRIEEFMKLDPEISGIPTHFAYSKVIDKLGLWPKPNYFYDVIVTGVEVFYL